MLRKLIQLAETKLPRILAAKEFRKAAFNFPNSVFQIDTWKIKIEAERGVSLFLRDGLPSAEGAFDCKVPGTVVLVLLC